MFDKLRNKIIAITMAITTVVLILAGSLIMLFSSTMRPDPIPRIEPIAINNDRWPSGQQPDFFSNQELKEFIKNDRDEGNNRLLITLLCVGGSIEIIVFIVSYYLSRAIVAPVKEAYNKQKLFVANASHELKTPLAVIQANMEALEVDEANEKWKDNIETEITHANKLVLNLLQLAKMDAGEIKKSAPEKLDLTTEIKSHIEMFQPKFSGKITFKSHTKAKEFTLVKQDFLQVLDILLDNATKYGKKKISITLEEKSLTVANDGTIIKKEDTTKIFDRFYQTDKTREGSGLGLAIAKAVCSQNDWQITCESKKNLTEFSVSF